MEFVVRKEEQIRLKEALSSDAPSMVVIYGRRRLGKSTLKKECYPVMMCIRSFIELDRHLPIETLLKAQFLAFVGRHRESVCRDAVTGNF